MTCAHCDAALAGRRTKYCSDDCYQAERRVLALARGRAGTTGHHGGRGAITDEVIAEVKTRFPSCARDWDVAMVEQAWDRLSTLLPRRIRQLRESDG